MVRESGTRRAATPMQIVGGQLPVFETRLGHGRYHALLDLGPGPAIRELRQFLEFEPARIHAAPDQVNLENLDPFFVERQVHEEHFIETSLANHFGR